VIKDNQLDAEHLRAQLEGLLAAPERRARMGRAMAAWAKPDAADRAADAILAVAKKKERTNEVKRAA
jgi:UDP-N-acetylglucosamine:LPS N-acetylglucosamine transferase